MTRTCNGCGQPLERKPGERPSIFARRNTCNRACLYAHRRAEAAARTAQAEAGRLCRQCARPLKRRPREDYPEFAARQFCGTRCRVAGLHAARAATGYAVTPAAKKARWRSEYDPAPAPKPPEITRAEPHETIRMRTLGAPCRHHPSERVNAWGQCPACTTGARWGARQRETTARPHRDGGR